MRTTITGMSRFGGGWMVRLGCGCSYRVTRDEAKKDQLFIGKTMTCVECGEERG